MSNRGAGHHDPIPITPGTTLTDVLRERVRRTPDTMAYREWTSSGNDATQGQWRGLSWRAFGDYVAQVRQALAGEQLPTGARVAIMLPNSIDWVALDQACAALGLVTVPIYFDDRPGNLAYLLRHSSASLLITANGGSLAALLRGEGGATLPESLQRVLLRCPALPPEIDAARERPAGSDGGGAAPWRGELGLFSDFVAATPPPSDPWSATGNAVSARDLATIVYTSGTTGHPKGVMLSHYNMLSNAAAAESVGNYLTDDHLLSFLPLSHMLERTGTYLVSLLAGASVTFARDIDHLAEDLAQVRPTILIAVPRIFERAYNATEKALAQRPALVRGIFRLAVAAGWRHFLWRQGRAPWHPLLLALPLRKRVAAAVLGPLGGRLRVAVCGGAALGLPVARLFIGLGLPLLQGYGLTESSPVLTVNREQDNIPESVGVPLPGVEVRIAGDGEILGRGPNIMLGYWQDEAATRAAIDGDGWLHTGDLGRMVSNHLFIVGRHKEIIVLSTGEKVAPVDIEQAICDDPLIEQAMVIGEGKPSLAVLLVLAPGAADTLRAGASADQSLEEILLRRVNERLGEFPGYARIYRVAVVDEPWSVENGCLTATLKLRRPQIVAAHAQLVAALYDR